MEKRVKLKERNIFKLIVIILFLFIFLISITFVSAADVAYIYKSKTKIDQNIINTFKEMNLSVELISEKNLTQNFSNFKLIFAGNEKFSNYKKIPVNDYNSVIMNNYRGFQWGITDRDGISKIARSKPLSVNVNGQIIQVYYQSLYFKKTISLPYLYLAKNNINPLMEKVAGVYIGDDNDKGDVISYLKSGSHLTNTKVSKGNICFYGIVESKYWTTEAKQLFKNCVNSVLINCRKDSDCSSDILGTKYCKNNSVHQNVSHYKCINPGSIESKCIIEFTNKSINNCSSNQICSNGMCLDLGCNTDSDCGRDGFDTNSFFCQNNIVFGNYINYICESPGQSNSSCILTGVTQLNKSCIGSEICSNAKCHNITCYNDFQCNDNNNYTSDKCNYPGTINASCSNIGINCLNKDDCGVDRFIGNLFCGNNLTNIMGTYLSYSCVGAGTPNSFCSNITIPLLNNACSNNQYCYAGICSNISCFSNTDCGTDRFDPSSLMCQNNSIYGNFTSRLCNNPGTPQSNCFSSDNFIQKDNCAFGCNSGKCLVHDVEFIDFTNAVDKIKIIDNNNNSNIILDNPAILNCNRDYKIYIKIINEGDFLENITYNGSINGLAFNHNPNTLIMNDSSEKFKTVNMTLLAGTYNITVNANIPNDNNPLDNVATREINVLCPY